MNSTLQWKKEVRQLGWAWAAVMLGAIVSFVNFEPHFRHSLTDMLRYILPIGTFFGVPLIAALPLGNEFQFRTVGLLISQPVTRASIWRLKIIITIAAVIPPTVLYCLASLSNDFVEHRFWLLAIAWVLVTTAAAIPFTLVARSTMGGMALNCAAHAMVFGLWTNLSFRAIKDGWITALAIPSCVALVAYAAFMFWLGRRMLVNMQSSDGMQAGEAVLPGENLMPAFLSLPLRARPTGVVANLMRREVRLLRFVWPLTAMSALAWICLLAFHVLPVGMSDTRFIAVAMTVMISVVIAVLAGTLSLGEEKTWGTHDWHMTLPISPSLQWFVKLFFALLTSVFCAAVVPISLLFIGGWLSGDPLRYFSDAPLFRILIAESAGITLVAFWCSCIVKGTVRATLWVFPVTFVLSFATQSASSLLPRMKSSWFSGFVTWLDPIRVERWSMWVWHIVPYYWWPVIGIVPIIAIMFAQTHRLFRPQMGEVKSRMIRALVPMVVAAVLLDVGTTTMFVIMNEGWKQQRVILNETHSAIEAVRKSQPLDQPLKLTSADLEKASSLSPRTRAWLNGSTLLVARAPKRPYGVTGYYFPGLIHVGVGNTWADTVNGKLPPPDPNPYSMVIRRPNGQECSFSYHVQGMFASLSGTCT